MPNFAQQCPILIFMPFIIILGVAAIVAVVNLGIVFRAKYPTRRDAPTMASVNRHLADKKSALTQVMGAALVGSMQSARPVAKLVPAEASQKPVPQDQELRLASPWS